MLGTYNDALVGSIAMLISAIAVGAAVGPWSQPYELKTISAVVQRHGKPMARAVWIVIAVASLVAGLTIFSGVRPSYARPSVESVP